MRRNYKSDPDNQNNIARARCNRWAHRSRPSRFAQVGVAHAQSAADPGRIDIFDAHLHYNQEPAPFYELDKVLEIFRRNGVTGILATSRPNKGTHQLMDAKAPGLWVVPFIRPYRTRSDIQTWFNDEGIYDLILEEYKRGYYRGIGEFHIYGKSAASEITKKIVNFAVDKNLYLHAHCDEEALLHLVFAQSESENHLGAYRIFDVARARRTNCWRNIRRCGASCPIAAASPAMAARSSPEWRDLFARHSDRFLIGSDTWINERWFSYDALMKGYREWLVQLPPDQAKRIATGNAEKLFGPRKAE